MTTLKCLPGSIFVLVQFQDPALIKFIKKLLLLVFISVLELIFINSLSDVSANIFYAYHVFSLFCLFRPCKHFFSIFFIPPPEKYWFVPERQFFFLVPGPPGSVYVRLERAVLVFVATTHLEKSSHGGGTQECNSDGDV